MTPPPTERLADALRAWDGSTDHAEALRTRFHAADKQRGRPEPGERGLAKFLSARGKGNGTALAGWLVDNPDEIPVVRALIGDPNLGPWPWEDPFGISRADAVAPLTLLGQVTVPPSPTIRRFVEVLFEVRQRDTWTRAARAMARQALGDPTLAATLEGYWARTFAGAVDAKKGLPLGGRQAHERRHVLVLCAVSEALRPDDSPGLDGLVAALARTPPPHDDADRSVLVLALGALADRDAIQARIPAHIEALDDHPLTERAWGMVCSDLPADLRDLLRARLATPRWTDTDGLLAWLHSVDTLGLGAELPPRPTPTSVFEVVDVLSALFHPHLGPEIPPSQRALQLVGVLEALQHPAIGRCDWANLARSVDSRALPAVSGRADTVGPTVLALGTALCGWPVEHLLRHAHLPWTAVLDIAPLRHPVVATQVALQTERALREAADDRERLRLLWQLLQVDPPHKTFVELERVLRSHPDVDTPMRGIVRVLETLDDQRESGTIEAVQPALSELAGLADDLLNGPHPFAVLAEIAELTGLTDLPSLVAALERLVAPRPVNLITWNAWVRDLSAEEQERWQLTAANAMHQLRRAIEALRDAHPRVEAAHAVEVRDAATALESALASCGWPESFVVRGILDRLLTHTADALEVGFEAARLGRTLDQMLIRGDETAIRALVDSPEQHARIAPADLERIQTFLLDQLLWVRAARLKRAASDRVALRGPSGRVLPLLAAVAGGSFLVLDFGQEWLKLTDGSMRHWGTLALNLGITWLVLMVTYGRRFLGASIAPRLLALCVRVAPIYAASIGVAVGATALVIASLDHPWSELPVFASLALFLGVFVGMVLQGQTVDDT